MLLGLDAIGNSECAVDAALIEGPVQAWRLRSTASATALRNPSSSSSAALTASYPDDAPFPSALVLGFDEGRPVHGVVARDAGTGLGHVVTVYHPDPEVWGTDLKTRREP
jgi:hypothetical protein